MKKRKEMSWRERRRRQAWKLKEKGWNQRQIAEAVGVTEGAISQWFKAADEQGSEEGLSARLGAGRPRRLRDEQLGQLPSLLAEGAEYYGFVGERWTGPRVAWLIKHELGVSYSARQAQRILHQVGYSRQKPQRVAQQRNEKAVEQFKTNVLPAVKKN